MKQDSSEYQQELNAQVDPIILENSLKSFFLITNWVIYCKIEQLKNEINGLSDKLVESENSNLYLKSEAEKAQQAFETEVIIFLNNF